LVTGACIREGGKCRVPAPMTVGPTATPHLICKCVTVRSLYVRIQEAQLSPMDRATRCQLKPCQVLHNSSTNSICKPCSSRMTLRSSQMARFNRHLWHFLLVVCSITTCLSCTTSEIMPLSQCTCLPVTFRSLSVIQCWQTAASIRDHIRCPKGFEQRRWPLRSLKDIIVGAIR